jgi:hypothetical protein
LEEIMGNTTAEVIAGSQEVCSVVKKFEEEQCV